MYELVKRDVDDIPEIKSRFLMILGKYNIKPREADIVVYTEGKNVSCLRQFLIAKAVAGCAKRTLQYYKQTLEMFFRSVPKDLDTITSVDIQMYLAGIMQRTSKVNADNNRRNLNSFYNWLYREEIIKKNPMNRVDKIKMDKKKKASFSEMEIEKLRNACETKRERAIIEVLLSTGCRVSEVTHMKISDIHDDSVGIIGKGNKFRIVYLNAKASIAVQMYLAERKDKSPYLFPKAISPANLITDPKLKSLILTTKKNWYKHPELVDTEGGVQDPSSIEAVLRRLGKRAGVEKVHPHRFRRTCATMALRRGMPLEQVSKMLGHEQLTTTQIYLDLSEEDLAAAHRKYVV